MTMARLVLLILAVICGAVAALMGFDIVFDNAEKIFGWGFLCLTFFAASFLPFGGRTVGGTGA